MHHVDVRLLDLDQWPAVDVDSLDERKREPYRRRRLAMIAAVRTRDIHLAGGESGISEKEVRRIFRRCIMTHRDGRIAGFRACVPYCAIKKYELKDGTKTGYAGLLGRLFRCYPLIEKSLSRFATSRRAGELTLPVRVSDIAFKLLELCRAEGFSTNEYPLNVTESAVKPLRVWYKRLLNTVGRAFMGAEYGPDAANQFDQGRGAYVPSVNPHRIMTFDEWTSHAFTAVDIPQLGGGTTWVPVCRYKFISGIRRGDRVLCACRPALRTEPDTTEFLATVEDAIRPHQRRDFTVPGFAYPAAPAFVSEIAGGEWLLPDLVLLDRSMVHLAAENRLAITSRLGCILLYGPPRRPRARGDVEAWHSFLAAKARKFSTTTGKDPSDPARYEPEKEAVRLHFHHDLLAQLTEILRVDYSTSGKKSLKGHTPIEAFQRWSGNATNILRHLPPSQREGFALSQLHVPVRISCDQKSGRQPVVRFKHAEYIGPQLAQMRHRNKEECVLVLSRGAAHIGRLFSQDGAKSEIDVLHTRGEWQEAHTLRERELYYEFKISRHVKIRDRDKSRVQQLREYCERMALSDKKMALICAEITKTAAESTPEPLASSRTDRAEITGGETEPSWRELNRL